MTHIKLAELTSGVGALVLGVGLGGLFPQWIGPAAGLITVVGLSLHAFGMWNKHRLEALGHAHNASWVVALYWVCWLLLAGVLALLLPLTDCMATVTPSPMSPALTPVADGGRARRRVVGLSSADAQRRLTEFGPNEIRREQATKALTLLVRQFASPVIGLLLVATVLSAALGEWLDAIAIGAIVILNAIIGFFQEHRAERAVMALRSMTAPRARVMREGHSVMMPANAIATTPNGARAHLLETLGNRTLIERRRRERRR